MQIDFRLPKGMSLGVSGNCCSDGNISLYYILVKRRLIQKRIEEKELREKSSFISAFLFHLLRSYDHKWYFRYRVG
jgi:hypothetical protein